MDDPFVDEKNTNRMPWWVAVIEQPIGKLNHKNDLSRIKNTGQAIVLPPDGIIPGLGRPESLISCNEI
jgi:hypothetical protein